MPPAPPLRVPIPQVQAQTPPPVAPIPAIARNPVPVPAPPGGAGVHAAPLPPAVPPIPQAGLFSQIHQAPDVQPPRHAAPEPPAGVVSQIHQAAAGTPPQASPPFEGFFSQIHQPPSPAPVPPYRTAPEADPLEALRPRVTFQDLTGNNDGSEASLDSALETLLKSGPPIDFSQAAPPPFFMPAADGEKPPAPFPLGHAGDGKGVFSPDFAETGVDNYLADLTNNARGTVPDAVFQTPLKPQAPPPPVRDVIPDLPDDKPKERASGDDSDFLKMFPGVGG